jgi:hypothetical protein
MEEEEEEAARCALEEELEGLRVGGAGGRGGAVQAEFRWPIAWKHPDFNPPNLSSDILVSTLEPFTVIFGFKIWFQIQHVPLRCGDDDGDDDDDDDSEEDDSDSEAEGDAKRRGGGAGAGAGAGSGSEVGAVQVVNSVWPWAWKRPVSFNP